MKDCKRYIGVILWGLLSLTAVGQDPQFSQFYSAPTYLNPAFTGNTIQNRVVLNYRYQWPSVPGAFISYNFSFDHFIPEINSGLGVLVTHDKAGAGGLQYTNLDFQYAYHMKINRTTAINFGMQYGYTWRSLDYAELVFGDQLLRGSSTSVEHAKLQNANYFDFSTGALLYGKSYWVGASVHHANQPNESLLQEESKVPFKLSVHGGYRIKLGKTTIVSKAQHIIPSINYKSQGKFDQLDIGVYYEIHPLVLGLWYRGIPVFKAYEPGYQNNDAVVMLVGYEIDKLRIGYSYDITVSRLVSNTGGSHEFAIIYEFASKRRELSRKRRVVPCSKF